MVRGRGWTQVAVVVLGLVAVVAPVAAQEREHYQLKVGAFYDQGDFGTSNTTRTLFTPLTLKYLGDRFDVALTSGFLRLDSPGGVTILEGQPVAGATARGARRVDEGVSDTVLKFRYFAVDDRGPNSLIPGLTPFAKIKFPTADEDKNLGTGEFDGGLGLEVDKQLGSGWFVFGDVSYTFIGSPPGQDLRDRPGFSLGVGRKVTDRLTLSAFLDWRRSLVSGRDDPTELDGVVSYKLTPTITASPIVFVGLTNGSPDFGVGIEFSWKFGRW